MKIAASIKPLILLLIPLCAAAAEPERHTVRSRLSEDAMRQAVRQTLAEQRQPARRDEGRVLRGDRYERFARQAEEATVPDCLHAEGLKRQPTFFLGGLLALPFVVVAKIRGKCQ